MILVETGWHGIGAPGALASHRHERGRVADHRRVIVTLDPRRLQTLDRIREFLDGSRPIDLQSPDPRANLEEERVTQSS